jgi:hypothetical protein
MDIPDISPFAIESALIRLDLSTSAAGGCIVGGFTLALAARHETAAVATIAATRMSLAALRAGFLKKGTGYGEQGTGKI